MDCVFRYKNGNRCPLIKSMENDVYCNKHIAYVYFYGGTSYHTFTSFDTDIPTTRFIPAEKSKVIMLPHTKNELTPSRLCL